MKLSKLAPEIWAHIKKDCYDFTISNVSLDSRKIKKNGLFFAYKGTNEDGENYINQAIENGATVVITESSNSKINWTIKNDKLFINVSNIKNYISILAANFYHNPVNELRLIGITGTNGKTSCSHFIANSCYELSIPCGIIGTLGTGTFENLTPSELTTPDQITLQKKFSQFVEKNVKWVSMEVSSHSLDQGRTSNLPFEIGIFTNLTQDHLDYHKNFQNYGEAKSKLFANDLTSAIINLDDAFGLELIKKLSSRKNIYGYSTKEVKNKLDNLPVTFAKNVSLNQSGIEAEIVSPWGNASLKTSLIGEFNLSNILAVITALCLMKIPFPTVVASMTKLKPVKGRMETIGGTNETPLIVVDYSHTPDSLEKALLTLQKHTKGKLLCLFGCGGNRDKSKRPIMAQVVEKYADFIMVTDDNPRHEPPQEIIRDIMEGFKNPRKVLIEHDRSKAIKEIIQCATPNDCILIAGKGAETYQQVGDLKIPFSDIVTVHGILAKKVQI